MFPGVKEFKVAVCEEPNLDPPQEQYMLLTAVPNMLPDILVVPSHGSAEYVTK